MNIAGSLPYRRGPPFPHRSFAQVAACFVMGAQLAVLR